MLDLIRSRILPHLEAGEAPKIRRHLSTVAENVYRSLPSGDYGRGDVREAILAILSEFEKDPS